jgi:DNA-binding response OmpR family regulator
MVTALDDWVNKRQALQTGADDFVEKPFELPKLAAAVERNLKLLSSTANAGTVSARN